MIQASLVTKFTTSRRSLISILPFSLGLSLWFAPWAMADNLDSSTGKLSNGGVSVRVRNGASSPAQKRFDLDARINKMRESAPNLSLPSTVFEPWWRTMFHDPDSTWLLRNFDIMSSDPDKKWVFPLGSGEYIPRIDIHAGGQAVKLSAEVPGIDANNLEVTVTADSVSIKGEKREKETQKTAKGFESVERHYGSFERTVSLPCRVDSDKAEATLKNGILTIVIPEVQEPDNKGKKLTIRSE